MTALLRKVMRPEDTRSTKEVVAHLIAYTLPVLAFGAVGIVASIASTR